MLKTIRNTLLKIAFWGGITAVAAQHFYIGLTSGRVLEHVEIPIRSSKITPDLEGYTIAFVTDVHRTKPKELRKNAREINARNPDLLLLGGDFSEERGESWESLKILAEIETVDGIYGVAGNHDIQKDLFAGMEMYGMTPLANEGMEIRPGLFVGGVEDYYKGKPDTVAALKDARGKDFTILLTHNPDLTMKQDTKKADITLAGHIHAGEVSLFGYWTPFLAFNLPPPLGTSEYYHRFFSGWAKSRDNRDVYVSNGVGKHGPIRIYAPAQVIYLTLLPEKKEKTP